jgi:hypothetical protein
MASWKKVIVSGSDAVLNQLTVGTSQVITPTNQLSTTKITGSFTGSFFGDGTGITGITATGLNIPGTVTVITNEPFVVSGSAALQKITLANVTSQITGSGLTKEIGSGNTISINTGSAHFVTGSRKAVFEDGRFVDSANIDFTVTSGVSVTGVIRSGSIQVGHLNVSSSTIGTTIVTLGQTAASLIGLTNVYSINLSGSNITASGLLHGTNISAATSITTLSGYITAGSPAGAPNTPGAVQGALGYFTSATLGSANVTSDLTVGGNLTVNGTTTFINTTNTYLKDQFLTLASGSTSIVDSGLLIASSSANVGNALYLEATSTGNFGRWAVAYNVSGSATAVTPDSYVVTVSSSAAVPAGTPTWGNTNGFGNMYINSSDESIWIYS